MENLQTNIFIGVILLLSTFIFILLPVRFFVQRGKTIGILNRIIAVTFYSIIGGIIGMGIISFFFLK